MFLLRGFVERAEVADDFIFMVVPCLIRDVKFFIYDFRDIVEPVVENEILRQFSSAVLIGNVIL